MKLREIKQRQCIVQVVTVLFLCTSLSRGEHTAEEPFAYESTDVASSMVLITCTLRGKEKTGNGVIVQMDDKPYLITNQHLILGVDNLQFTTASGDRLSPKSVELSNNRDLARLALDEGQALSCSEQIKMNTPIAIFAGMDEKMSEPVHGMIIGIGGGKIEISAEFDKKNSGAPALNAEKEVVGIASYNRGFSKHAMKTGTRFDTDSRHFCSRLDKANWQQVNWKSYNKKYGTKYQKHKAFYDELIEILTASEQFDASVKRTRELATQCRTHARQVRILCEQRDLTDFLLNEFEEQAEVFEYVEGLFLKYIQGKEN